MDRLAHHGTKRGKLQLFELVQSIKHEHLAGLPWGTLLDIYSQESIILAKGSNLHMCVCLSVWASRGGGRCFLHHLLFFFDHFFTHSAQFLISRQYFLTAFLAEGRLWLLSVFSGLLPNRLSAGVLLSNEIFMETPSFMPYLCLWYTTQSLYLWYTTQSQPAYLL